MATKIDDKGINVTEWLFKILWGLSVYFMVDLHNQTKQDRKDQSIINRDIINILNQIQQINAATAKDNGYILKELSEIKQEQKEQDRRIRDLERKTR